VKEFSIDNKIIARLIQPTDWIAGLSFLSQPDDFIQVGTWVYPEGKTICSHFHNPVSKSISHTQEVLFVKSGSLKTVLFDFSNKPFEEIVLSEGDIIILLDGGHSFTILEDNTQVLEIKTGPYSGSAEDKTNF